MSKFIVRVELHDIPKGEESSKKVYQILHDAMEEMQFKRTIVGKTGVEYHLPRAVYFLEANDLNHRKVRDLTRLAAEKTKLEYSVIASQFRAAAWFGLTEVGQEENE